MFLGGSKKKIATEKSIIIVGIRAASLEVFPFSTKLFPSLPKRGGIDFPSFLFRILCISQAVRPVGACHTLTYDTRRSHRGCNRRRPQISYSRSIRAPRYLVNWNQYKNGESRHIVLQGIRLSGAMRDAGFYDHEKLST